MSKLTDTQRQQLREAAQKQALADKQALRDKIAAEQARDERAYVLIQQAQRSGAPLSLAEARAQAAPGPAANTSPSITKEPK